MRDDVSSGSVKAARIALAEIAEILETYPGAVVAGGFVPYLLIPQHVEPHEGTVDIDLVLAFDQPGGDDVFTLHEILERRLFQQDPGKPFRYTKGIDLDGEIYPVMVELLGGGNPPPGGLRRIGTEDVHLSIISGMEVALEGPLVVSIPDTPNRTISVASIPSFLSMKAFALERREERKKPKDAYDIVYCLRNYDGGVGAIAQVFREKLPHAIIASAVESLGVSFGSTDAVGPVAYAPRGQ
ncbi:MAG: nucleotidyl transferase AbiEii/AbiGii toxin family protein [Fimbriimonadaceae bacterium]|nr:nucleotidyl transferase AbiEii/AbiGii toxin family protein [Chthonomonadaceae bacterium]MCO5298036.1 nucleotidyl transferase AbiEii/AbiGii toxin family protein [Fimbriimonadaceae bacterium]